MLDNLGLITDPTNHHLGLDTGLAYLAQTEKPLWIVVNTSTAAEGLDLHGLFHWVTFEVQISGQSIKVLHYDSLPNSQNAHRA